MQNDPLHIAGVEFPGRYSRGSHSQSLRREQYKKAFVELEFVSGEQLKRIIAKRLSPFERKDISTSGHGNLAQGYNVFFGGLYQ